ncbi:hypothetical protein [Phenylobacterium sp.]|uniref:hypothetical protein n=1 Tax=Phenylobacterium sp. TaxID=1871053 RepID=UPI002C0FC944|nr:hypothetical protein [Phenylobacterium sp.]HLZ75508.1 hypothetical protein [Phenylobacterium sp.]
MKQPEHDPCANGAAARRITSVDLAAALDQFSDAGLLTEGKVNLIALDAIVERLGVRWTTRRAQIHDYVARFIERRLGSDGYHLRISETDFLICQPEVGRFAGQAACLQILRDVLTHFIGDATLADDCVHQVTKVSASEIQGTRVRASEVEKGERMEREALASARPRRTLDRWTPFVASDGRELRVACRLEPVVELKSFGQIGFRIARRVLVAGSDEAVTAEMVRKLSRADIMRIDLAAAARGMEALRMADTGEAPPSLIMPVSFISLASQRGRTAIAGLLMEARDLVKRGVICEISDIEGVPQGVMLHVVSLIRPYCLFVVARIDLGPPAAATLAQLRHSGVQALSVESPRGLTDAAFLRWMKTTVEAARRVVRSMLLYQLAAPQQAALAAKIGATHASVGEWARDD